jgi:zinc/manganese transport system substrate-binding protein
MQRKIVFVTAVLIVAIVAAAGLYEAFVVSPAPSPCSGVTTPSGPAAGTTPSVSRPAGSPVDAVVPSVVYEGNRSAGGRETGAPPGSSHDSTGPVIQVVAAEDFWGSLVSQLGGSHVNVTSIITDPNADPHEYASNDSTAIAFQHAQYVILNNVGYDDWAKALIAGDGGTNQTVLNIGDSLGVSVTGNIVSGNPHLWYNPAYVNQTVAWMYHNLTAIAPTLSGYFSEQDRNVTDSLASLYSEVGTIRAQFAGTIVASTESIFVYLANATGLDLVSPPAFMEAVAEGNDPPDPSVVTFQCQLESGHVRVLVFNAQTVTPLTTSMKAIAQENNVSVTSLTETIVPPSATFQQWMGGELNSLYVALDANALGQ